jgi:3-dehydroquinate synthase
MRKIDLKTNSPCKIVIDKNLIQNSGNYIKNLSSTGQVLIITDDLVNELYSNKLTESLIGNGFEVFLFVLTRGEPSKNFHTVERIYSFLIKNKFTRSDLIIALGGGVIGDIAGFVAATYMRGMGFIQIPTTLLAQIDSSIGGKNGINLSHGKNLIGTFYQPKLVLIDVDTLSTLPEKLISDGMAEAIKYGLIKSLT